MNISRKLFYKLCTEMGYEKDNNLAISKHFWSHFCFYMIIVNKTFAYIAYRDMNTKESIVTDKE